MARPSSETALLDREFVRELDVLRRRLEVRARSGSLGELVARRKGGSSEFREHRPYAHGDDLRRIDWSAYARSGEPVLKVFQSEEDVVVRVVCDASASLDFGTPPKIEIARKLAAAIGYLALARSERAEAFASGERLRFLGGARGKGGLVTFLRHVGAVEAKGATDLAAAIDSLVERSRRPGMLALVSDFLDAGPLVAALVRAASAGHDVALVHVVAPEEIEPPFEGDFTFEDAETGDVVDVTIDAESLRAYAARFEGLCRELRSQAKRIGAVYVRARTDEPLLESMRRFVGRSID